MFSRSAARRPVAGLALTLLAMGAAGCGGSGDDEKDGANTAYAGAWNEVCTAFTAAQTDLQSDVAAAQKAAKDQSAAQQKRVNIRVMSRFFDRSAAVLERAEGLDAPSELQGFQRRVDSAVPGTVAAIRDLKGPLATGDPQAVYSVAGRLDPKKVFPALPAALKSKATACALY